MSNLHDKWLRVVSGRTRGIMASGTRAGLSLLSVVYRTGAAIGRMKKRFKADIPVISIGNITAGGTGKTPLTEFIAAGLHEGGHKPAIVMRGYKGADNKFLGSDEAALLTKNLADHATIIINPNRFQGVQDAAKNHAADIALLDDGFQHHRLERNLDIVTIDATQPFGFGKLLPAGLLRESPKALNRARIVIITRADIPPPDELANIRTQIQKHAPEALIINSTFNPHHMEIFGNSPTDKNTLELKELKDIPVAAFCGIGNPYGFEMAITNLGAELVEFKKFDDHHAFTENELARVVKATKAKDAKYIITTQKDSMRIAPKLWAQFDLPLLIMRSRFELLDDTPEQDLKNKFWLKINSVFDNQ